MLFSDLEDSRLPCIKDKLEQFHIRRLESLKFWLLHAIGSIHTYLSGQVLQSLGLILEQVLAQTDSLDTIISGNMIITIIIEEKEISFNILYEISNLSKKLNEIVQHFDKRMQLLCSAQ